MAIDEFEKVNEAAGREDARQARASRVRAAWRAHPVLVSIGALALAYAVDLFKLFNGPVQHRGSSLFLNAGIVTGGALVLVLGRLWWRHHRAKSAGSDFT
jgi:hypothetical protein